MIGNGALSTLAELISPMTQQEFFDCFINQRPVFIRGEKASGVAKLINVNDVTDIIKIQNYASSRIRMRSQEEEVPPSLYTTDEPPRMSLPLMRRILNAGASLIVMGVDEVSPKIGDLAQALELEFSSRVWINAYLTTKKGGAFPAHYDNHDVIVVQISGSKRWHLYGRSEEFPVDSFDRERNIAPEEVKKIDILRAGEVLFIPRGEYHRAEVVDSPSLHLTIAIGGFTGLDLVLDSASKDLKREVIFRKYLPRVGSDELLLDHEKKLKSFLHDWVERLSAKALFARDDAARAPRSYVIPWNKIALARESKVRLALRRRSPIVDLDGAEIVVGGRTYHTFPTERLILRTIDKFGVLRFDELIGRLRTIGETTADAELAEAVVYLAECGLLNISLDDEASKDNPKDEIISEANQDTPHSSGREIA